MVQTLIIKVVRIPITGVTIVENGDIGLETVMPLLEGTRLIILTMAQVGRTMDMTGEVMVKI